jgi:hypothetical protein
MRIARAWIDDFGQWWLSVAGTDIEKHELWHDQDVQHGYFPGNSLGHRLIDLGWMPDRRAMYGALSMSEVEKLALTALAGWRPAGENAWVIPCYREIE